MDEICPRRLAAAFCSGSALGFFNHVILSELVLGRASPHQNYID